MKLDCLPDTSAGMLIKSEYMIKMLSDVNIRGASERIALRAIPLLEYVNSFY